MNSLLSRAELQALRQMENVPRELPQVEQLAAGLAHEINTPLGYVQSNFDMLRDYLPPLLDLLQHYRQAEDDLRTPDVAAALRTRREAAQLDFLRDDIPQLMREAGEGIARVRQMVQDMRAFACGESGPEWQCVDLHPGIDATLDIARSEVRRKADIVREYGDLPPLACLPSQIYQVVMNLVVNAAHAMDARRGRITVRTGRAGDNGWLAVCDTGSGIAPEVLPRIFEPFYTTKPVGEGTGLGLALVQGIVQRHGGRIEVETAPGLGSTFRVLLPLRQQGPAPAGLAVLP